MRSWRSVVGVAVAAAAGMALSAPASGQAPAVPPAPPPPGTIAPGVSIAGVPVGGLPQATAARAVITQHVAPRHAKLVVTFRGRNLVINPVQAGYVAGVAYAVKVAMLYGRREAVPVEGVVVPLRERVNRKKLRAIITSRAKRYSVPARDARLVMRGVTPTVRKPRVGVTVNVPKAARQIEEAIFSRARPRYPLASKRVRPDATSVGPVVIIERDRFRVSLWRAGKIRARYPVAVGTSSHPTPAGNFRIVSKQRNPTWFPPSSPWAAGFGPVPPGVGNPLGTRWMGTSAPAIGLHGTPVPSSIGTRASHGCIRMHIGDAERLYGMVDVGTPVIIR